MTSNNQPISLPRLSKEPVSCVASVFFALCAFSVVVEHSIVHDHELEERRGDLLSRHSLSVMTQNNILLASQVISLLHTLLHPMACCPPFAPRRWNFVVCCGSLQFVTHVRPDTHPHSFAFSLHVPIRAHQISLFPRAQSLTFFLFFCPSIDSTASRLCCHSVNNPIWSTAS